MFFKPLGIILPVWPTYALLQSGYVSLHMQLRRYFAIVVFIFLGWGGRVGCLRLYFLELLVLKAVFKLIYLNTLVVKVASFPIYVKDSLLLLLLQFYQWI